MGVGKSTTGPIVAAELGVGYYDTDDWMETKSGITKNSAGLRSSSC